MHAATARWIADRTAGAMGEDAEIVVHHLDAALELAPSAPELDTEPLTELLVDCPHRGRGSRAARSTCGRAISFLVRATDRSPEDPRHARALLPLAHAYRALGNFAEALPILEQLVERDMDSGAI